MASTAPLALCDTLSVDDRPTFRGIVKALWPLVSNQTGRDLKKMGRVRPQLMRVVYSNAADDEAANTIRPVVRSDPRGARATLAYVTQARDYSLGYETDRAYRVLRAAMTGAEPEPVSPDKAAQFEREKALGWSPLGDAFDRLADEVPEFREIAQLVQSKPATNEWAMRVEQLIGPRSSQHDALLRSSLASTVAFRYFHAVGDASDDADLRRPVWRWSGRSRI